MTKPFTKAKVPITVIAIVAVLLVIGLFALPVTSELSRINKVRDHYRRTTLFSMRLSLTLFTKRQSRIF